MPVPPNETWRLEQFSRAYVQAVASAANCSVEWANVDNDSVDGSLRWRIDGQPIRRGLVDFQLKATAQDCLRENHLEYYLKIKNYDDLRTEGISAARILIVVLLHPEVDDWTDQDEENLVLRRCGYWVSIRGEPEVSNVATRVVHLPRNQVFDPAALDQMLAVVHAGDLL